MFAFSMVTSVSPGKQTYKKKCEIGSLKKIPAKILLFYVRFLF